MNRFRFVPAAIAASPSHDDAVSFHERLAAEWERKYRKSSFATRQRIVGACLAGIPLRGMSWLDAGCGSGTLARWLAEQGCQVEAVDASLAMVGVARQACFEASRALRITVRQVATIENLPFPSNCFDGILCSSVLEYVSHPSACLGEFSRLLRPGGVLLISVPSARSFFRMLLRVAHTSTSLIGRPWPTYLSVSRHQYSISEFCALLQAHHFRPEQHRSFGAPAARWFRGNECMGSLLMFRATRLGAGHP